MKSIIDLQEQCQRLCNILEAKYAEYAGFFDRVCDLSQAWKGASIRRE